MDNINGPFRYAAYGELVSLVSHIHWKQTATWLSDLYFK